MIYCLILPIYKLYLISFFFQLQPDNTNKFEWNQYQQGLILGSFYWLHWLPQIPSGIWAQKYGTKVVFGLTNVISSWMCFFIPMAAFHSANALIFLRALQGLVAVSNF